MRQVSRMSSLMPKISWITTTTGAGVAAGKATKAEKSPSGVVTVSALSRTSGLAVLIWSIPPSF
ncbi:hypothetical protein D9M71_787630 [compost metagenome]